jgi:branched-chain amino acid transport system ATP-binding protein
MLRTVSLSKIFGGLSAVDSVTYEVGNESILGLIGPNGAGKTTFLNMVAGILNPTKGEIYFTDQNITEFTVPERVKIGIIKTSQISSVFTGLSVLDNVLVGLHWHQLGNWKDFFWGRSQEERNLRKATRVIKDLGLYDYKDKKVGAIPPGYKKLTELGMVMMLNPKLILMDEPTAGLVTEETKELSLVVEELSKSCKILIVEHRIGFIMSLAERITVMNKGKLIAEGTPEEIQRDVVVKKVYLGD